jgi:hypothetical protein
MTTKRISATAATARADALNRLMPGCDHEESTPTFENGYAVSLFAEDSIPVNDTLRADLVAGPRGEIRFFIASVCS